MCKMDILRRNTMAAIGLEVGTTVRKVRAMRAGTAGLRLKDLDVLDRLDDAMMEAAKYLADELEGKE